MAKNWGAKRQHRGKSPFQPQMPGNGLAVSLPRVVGLSFPLLSIGCWVGIDSVLGDAAEAYSVQVQATGYNPAEGSGHR
jgi:hypothetical protein